MPKRFLKLVITCFVLICSLCSSTRVISAEKYNKHLYPVFKFDIEGELVDTLTYQYEEGETFSGVLSIFPGSAASQKIKIYVYKWENNDFVQKSVWTTNVDSSKSYYESRLSFNYDELNGLGTYKFVLISTYYNTYASKYLETSHKVGYFVNYVKKISATGIKLSANRLSMRIGDTNTLSATVLPAGANQKVTWESSDPNIVTVDNNGTVQAAGPGNAKVTATAKNGISAACNVTVLSEEQVNLITEFVTRLYRLCLDREPDTGGLNNWVDQLCTGKRNAAGVINGFFFSTEFKNLKLSNEEFVERCYRVLMDRASDAGGKQNWVSKLEIGVSNSYILKGFVESVEFTKVCDRYGVTRGTITLSEARDKNLGVTQFVGRCYQEVLGRKADTGGLNSWCNFILSSRSMKQGAIQVASDGFFYSKEYLNKNTSNEDYVYTLYRTFLGRDPDFNGYTDWSSKLTNGTDRKEVLKGFANSAEFAKIMESYGIR